METLPRTFFFVGARPHPIDPFSEYYFRNNPKSLRFLFSHNNNHEVMAPNA